MQHSVSINVTNAGKKFGKEWIFRNVTLTILPSEKLAITGLNGSGKSTLLQALTGFIQLNEGAITYANQLNSIDEDSFYKYISLSSPYLELKSSSANFFFD